MNSKSILFLLLLALCLLANPLSAATFGNFTYTDNGSSITITGYPRSATGGVVIPATIVGKPVTLIDGGAFLFCASLSSVTIPDSVTSIGGSAFSQCISLTRVTIPDNVKSIGDQAFQNCTSLTSVVIGNSVTSIGNYAFDECTSLTSLMIGSALISIGDETFYHCRLLTSVTIPNSVTSIGNFAFDECTSLTSVVIDNSVTSIGDSAFSGCTSLTTVALGSAVISIGNSAFFYCHLLTDVTIPNSVTSIGAEAFSVCTALTSVTIGNSVTSIGNSAFSACRSLASVTIPNSVTSIGDQAFFNCDALVSIDVDSLNMRYRSLGGVLFNKIKTTLVQFLGGKGGTYAIPNSVTSIKDGAFYSCDALISIEVDSSNLAYSSLDGVLFNKPQTVLIAFPGGKGGAYVIPNSVTSVGDSAIHSCRSLTSVTIPNSVNYLGAGAFDACSSLISIKVDSSNPNYSSLVGVLFNKKKTILMKFPEGKGGVYSIPSSVTSMGNYSFYYCTSLTSVTLPNNLTSIGGDTFYGCSSLVSIEVDSSNPNLSSLDGVLFNKLQTTILAYPQGKGGAYTIPNSVTAIGDSAFEKCTSLTSVTLPNSVTSIGNYAFEKCTSLISVIIPYSVTSIGYGAFDSCISLAQAIFLGDAPTSSSTGVFDNTSRQFTVVFIKGSTGFTTPTWNGYPAVARANAPDIGVQQPLGSGMVDGVAKRSFGSMVVGSATAAKFFTIVNTGTQPLTGLAITKDGANKGDFIVTAPVKTTLAPGETTTFTVTFKPTATGTRTAAFHIGSNDPNENPFDVLLTGLGT